MLSVSIIKSFYNSGFIGALSKNKKFHALTSLILVILVATQLNSRTRPLTRRAIITLYTTLTQLPEILRKKIFEHQITKWANEPIEGWTYHYRNTQKELRARTKTLILDTFRGNGTELDLRELTDLEALPDLSSFNTLKTLNINGLKKIRCIPGLSSLTSLETLDLGDCESFRVTHKFCSSLRTLQMLTRLNLSHVELGFGVGCDSNFHLISALNDLRGLKELNISWQIDIEKLPDLSSLVNLEILIVNHCCELRELNEIEKLTSLKTLDVSYNRNLLYISYFPYLDRQNMNLERVIFNDCTDIRTLPGEEILANAGMRLKPKPTTNTPKITFDFTGTTVREELTGRLRSEGHTVVTN